MDHPLMSPEQDPFVFFDLGNVLLLFDHQIAWQQMAQLCELDPETVRDAVFRSPLQLQYERGAISSQEFYQYFCQQLKVQPDYRQLMFCNDWQNRVASWDSSPIRVPRTGSGSRAWNSPG